jgi:two-component sensor histidine kinase
VRKVEAEFTPDLGSARLARRFADDSLASVDVDADLAVLLVSELATNAVMHARTDFIVRVWVNNDRGVRIEVEDENERRPSVAYAPIEATSGRGLQLVQTLSDAWGVDARQHGKVVWFELSEQVPDAAKQRSNSEDAFAS